MSSPEVESPRPGVTRDARAWTLLALRVGVSAAVLTALFVYLPRDEMRIAFERIAFVQWLVILLCMAALHTLTAAKWRMLVRAAGVPCRLGQAIRAHGAGLFAGLFLPGLIGTDVVRATLLARSEGGVAPVTVGSVADRLVDTASLVFLAALGAALASGGGAYWATPAFAFAALVVGSFAARPTLRLLAGERAPRKLRGIAQKLVGSLDALLTRPSVALYAFVISAALQAGFVMLSLWLGLAVGIHVPMAAWFLAFPLAKLTLLVPVTISGLGVREAALAGLLFPFGVDPAIAVVQGLLWQTLQMGLALLGGLTAYLGRNASTPEPLAATPAGRIHPS